MQVQSSNDRFLPPNACKQRMVNREWINPSGVASPLDPGSVLSEDADYKEKIEMRTFVTKPMRSEDTGANNENYELNMLFSQDTTE